MTDPSRAVVHLTLRKGDIELGIATGVLYCKGDRVFIVTAWHNLSGRHSLTLKPLSKTGAFPDNLIAYVSCRHRTPEFEGTTRLPFVVSLEDSTKTFYLIHQQTWPRIDVAAIPIDPSDTRPLAFVDPFGKPVSISMPMQKLSDGTGVSSEIECIQSFEKSAATLGIDVTSDLSVSDQLFILGYPRGIIDQYGQPLWKRATVASSPKVGWEKQEKFLVDCASREGMSGAPTIFYHRKGPLQIGPTTYVPPQAITAFQGIYVGRIGGSEFEVQIGTVWKRSVVDEILMHDIEAAHSSQIEASPEEIREAIKVQWPSSDSYASTILGPGSIRDGFTHTVMEHLLGRADPEYVLGQVLEFAKTKISETHQK